MAQLALFLPSLTRRLDTHYAPVVTSHALGVGRNRPPKHTSSAVIRFAVSPQSVQTDSGVRPAFCLFDAEDTADGALH